MPSDITLRKPHVPPAAVAAVAEIESATGRRCTVEQIAWLLAEADGMVQSDRESPKLCDLPTECGGALLYPLSFFAAQWYQEVAWPHFGDDKRVLGYTMSRSFDRETLQSLVTRKQIMGAVNAWLLSLRCGPDALSAAVDRVLGRDSLVPVANLSKQSPSGQPRACDWGDSVAMLCEKYPGTSPVYWSCQVSAEFADQMLLRAVEERHPDASPSAPSWSAMARFRCLVEHIKQELKRDAA